MAPPPSGTSVNIRHGKDQSSRWRVSLCSASNWALRIDSRRNVK